MAKQRSTFGSITKILGRPGYYFRFQGEGFQIVRKAGATRAAAETKRANVQTLVGDGMNIKDAVKAVWSGRPAPATTRTGRADDVERAARSYLEQGPV